jgi:ATP-dependent Lhr-like helicase
MKKADPLARFSPLVRDWFRTELGVPTPAQELGWPAIAAGRHTLILAPTGSGKTLAAFLWALNTLLTRPAEPSAPAVHTLYISPLKALGYDIERNLQYPLAGIQAAARASGTTLPEVRVGVRTGDTPSSERQLLVRRPPHILITTPESLHLLLTSPRARDTLASVRTVIVDEIHALAPNKRGTFLSVLLERLESLTGDFRGTRLGSEPDNLEPTTVPPPFQRIGLSATIRPLDLVARFLGGYGEDGRERSVRVVDAGLRKELDLQVVSPVEDMTALPEGSVWPAIYARLHELILAHRSTIVFVNNRRSAERIAAEVNELAGYELAQVHHGSVAKERRHEIEEKLKHGEIPAIVATASLELGIDMGAVDLVCQVESPHGVARGLQRVGRAGHLYRAPSRGRLLPKTRADLLEMAALARAMLRSEIADVRIPRGCLDILAQQIVAIVAGGEIRSDDLLRIVRRAYPFHDLPQGTYLSVLAMLAAPGAGPWSVRPRIAWDRVNDVLLPLPGSRRLAVTSGGAIPDTGQYGVYTEAGDRIGELDEEFVYEARVGEVLVLGLNRWRIIAITHDRVVVAAGDGPAKIPFWKGEAYGREVELGEKVGALAREIESRLDDPQLVPWLEEGCALDRAAAENLVRYVAGQHDQGAVPTDRRLVIEGFPDEAGGLRLAVLTPYGSRFHLALRTAFLSRFRDEHGIQPDSLHGNGGILLRITQLSFDHAVRTIRGIRAEEVEGLVLQELGNSPLFGLRFRENAGRALLLPRDRPGKRTPLWLRRLSARDLLEAARARPGFPIVTETYREILADFLPLDAVRAWLRGIQDGEIQVSVRRGAAPSPFAASLLWEFQAAYIYQWDEPKPGPLPTALAEPDLLPLLGRDLAGVVDSSIVDRVDGELRGSGEGRWARTGAELLSLLRRVGDVGEDELSRVASPDVRDAVPALLAAGSIARLEVPGCDPSVRLVLGEDLPLHRAALAGDGAAQAEVVQRHAASRALASPSALRARYPFPEATIESALATPPFVSVTWQGEKAWTRQETLERLRRLTLAARQARVRPHGPAALQAFALRHQHRAPEGQLEGEDGVAQVLTQLQGIYLPWATWDTDALPARVAGYRAAWVEDLLRSGEFTWLGRPGPGRDLAVSFAQRVNVAWLTKAYPPPAEKLPPEGAALLERLNGRGPSFLVELAGDVGLPATRCAALLWNLARAGLVTNDGLAPLQAGPPPLRPGKTQIWRGGSGWWSLLPSGAGDPTEDERESLLRLLLARYGILSRGVLAWDGAAVPWDDLYPRLTRREWRGELARGLVVEGLAGAQFAREEAVRGLDEPGSGWALVPSADPALLYGAGAVFPLAHPADPEWKFRRGPGSYLVLREGHPVLAIEGHGERLTNLAGLPAAELRPALGLLATLVSGPVRRLTVRTWDGQPVRGSPIEGILHELGFRAGPDALILYRRYGTDRA